MKNVIPKNIFYRNKKFLKNKNYNAHHACKKQIKIAVIIFIAKSFLI